MAALFKFILIVALSYYLIRLLIRTFFPKILKHYVNKMNSQINNEQYDVAEEKKREGEVTIRYVPEDENENEGEQDKKIDGGEYVDYEEIKD